VEYVIEYTDTLMLATWITLTSASGNGGLVTFSDLSAAGARRFCRIRIN
jgi:hypothetical protein